MRIRLLIGLLVLAALLISSYSTFHHAPTYDETGHLVAGLSHWKFSRFELYRVNPPLARLVQTLPVIGWPHEEEWTGYSPMSPTRQEFSVARQFIEANGQSATTLFTIARLAGLVFFLLGAWMCFLLGRRLYGCSAGVAACGLWCWSPTVLGHAALITPDVPAAAMGLVAIYWVMQWLDNADWGYAYLAGLAVAGAMATKADLDSVGCVCAGVGGRAGGPGSGR